MISIYRYIDILISIYYINTFVGIWNTLKIKFTQKNISMEHIKKSMLREGIITIIINQREREFLFVIKLNTFLI